MSDGTVAVAIRSIACGKPLDLVLMDMQMIVMDGRAATQRLRQLGLERLIVALTAHAMAGDRERCIQVGRDGCETNPVEANRRISTCEQFGMTATRPMTRIRWLPGQVPTVILGAA